MKVAVVGATGLVGQVMIKLLEERNFPLTELIPVASEKSVGKKISFKGQEVSVQSIQSAIDLKPEIALFSAGGETSLAYAEKFAAVGTTVIDNSSAWRMDPTKKLIVPEVNAGELTKEDKIIANPNCSTIQMVLTLAPIHKKYGIDRIVISTYQSITGTGVKALEQLKNEQSGKSGEMAYAYQIHENCIPQCDVFMENDYTKEEMKLVNEPKKIMGDDSLKITATAVRVPVMGGHAESINLSLKNSFEVAEIKELLSKTKGIVVKDNPANAEYPMPLYSKDKDEVFVGRIRRDESQENGLNLWIVADNLRKGAATNTIQIAEYLLEKGLV
ncbi:MAG: aspartate-semialdehyde dehydrogenase [Flavobacteriales bacterium]|nr:aspartate-semialdehyde dehydrogenase [Flavobacteriales bacterium]|tara:strand:+ start:5485 stop:6474 length:990 start_codon:yes stop_codon:yes gene_type:complete